MPGPPAAHPADLRERPVRADRRGSRRRRHTAGGTTGALVCGLLAGCGAPAAKSSASGATPSGGGLPTGVLAVLAVLVLLAAAAGFWAGTRTRRTAPAPAPDLQLVRGLIGSHDLTADDAQRGHIEQVLQGVGVLVLRPPPGSPLTDPRLEVVGTRAAPSPGLAGSVADVVRVGWVDGRVLVRPAQVVVYAPAPNRSDAEETSPGEPHR